MEHIEGIELSILIALHRSVPSAIIRTFHGYGLHGFSPFCRGIEFQFHPLGSGCPQLESRLLRAVNHFLQASRWHGIILKSRILSVLSQSDQTLIGEDAKHNDSS